MTTQTNKMGKELGKKIFPSRFTFSYFIILIELAALTAITACFSLGLFFLGEFITKGWLNALAIIAFAAEAWLLISLITSAINAMKIRNFANAKVERVSLFCMHLDVMSKLIVVIGSIITALALVYSCVWFCSAFNILPKFVDFMGSVINGIFGWNLNLEDPSVVTPLMKTVEFAKSSPVAAVILSIILPAIAGVATYFGFATHKKTLRSYESMHVDSNAPHVKAPVILLFIYGGIFACIGLFLIVFFFTKLGDASVFTNIFNSAKESAVDTIYEGIEDAFENLTNEKIKKMELFIKLKEAVLNLVGNTLRPLLTFTFNVLISLLSVLRYVAFLAFDLSLVVFGGYLITQAVMFMNVDKPAVAPVAAEIDSEIVVEE